MISWLRSVGLRLLLAFLLAFALWVFVSYTQNPDRRIPFDQVPVDVRGLEPGLVLVDTNGLPRSTRPTVNVTVEAAADTLVNVSERDIRAFVDVEGLGPGQHVRDVQVEPARDDLLRLRFTPDPFRLPIRLDQEITRTVPLSVEISGVVPFSFEALDPRVSVRGQQVLEASVRGPANRVEQVVRVRAAADIDRLTSTYNSPRALEAIAVDGRVVDGVTIDPPQVNVQVPIISSVGIKRVPVVPQIGGEPTSGYYVASVSVSPQLVTLTGSSGPLDDVQSVSTELVDVGGASRTFTRTVALLEPLSARLQFGQPREATVTVEVRPITSQVQVTLPVPVQAVNVGGGLIVSLSPAVVQVPIQGRPADLGRLDPSTLVATVSMRDLGAGVYTVVPDVALPDGLTLAGDPTSVTVTLRVPATPIPTLTPTETPGAPPDEATPTPDGGGSLPATEVVTETLTPAP